MARALRTLARWSPVTRFVVADDSMLPAYAPGDRVLVNRIAYRRRRPRLGDAVVLRDPENLRGYLLKRVAVGDCGGDQLYVLGDNAALSRDSRSFGCVDARPS